ncbi:Putative protein [Zobellia galactanivorans]|uniref:Uncharacterized protein n=1 Tax=Zobellia galactanivorans (strain DSM 12802 / CCUG 47099 / CIP 106680 / NCIMB 13871 / Dsij) TaxID=63186 RepID=G0L5F6_ZOBGA|nr:Putative protein [Zobellia galactanivorans]
MSLASLANAFSTFCCSRTAFFIFLSFFLEDFFFFDTILILNRSPKVLILNKSK